jgi:hypothetical protein
MMVDQEIQRLIIKASSKFYEEKGGWKHITMFTIEGYSVLAESESDAQEIYKIATNQK